MRGPRDTFTINVLTVRTKRVKKRDSRPADGLELDPLDRGVGRRRRAPSHLSLSINYSALIKGVELFLNFLGWFLFFKAPRKTQKNRENARSVQKLFSRFGLDT
jgi:hypothetical protein